MQINQVRLSQPQNKPAFAGKAFINTKNAAKMANEVFDIINLKANTRACINMNAFDNGLAIFAPDEHIATAIGELAKKDRLQTDLQESISRLLQTGGEKLAEFWEKVK